MQLGTFLAVCEYGSFSKAAAKLFVTPSAVIQQINTLEADLGVVLFDRTRKGVSLTQAGEYLRIQGEKYVQTGDAIKRNLLELASGNKVICIGSSIVEKCRLLHNLWTAFCQKQTGYEIKMVNIEPGHVVPSGAEFVESVQVGLPWTQGWNFLKLCQVPLCFAFPKDHPLSSQKIIHLEELRGMEVKCLNKGTQPLIRDYLQKLEHQGISLSFPEEQGTSMLWECSFSQKLLLVPKCWEDLLLNMVLVDVDWDFTIPYGIFYRPTLSQASQTFLDFIQKNLQEKGPCQLTDE